MADNVVFEDYSVEVKNVIKEKAIAFLNEIGGEIVSQTQRNSRRKTSQTAGSFEYVVDEGELAVHIGSNYKNAIWEEFGTGIHAINGDGRKTPWRWRSTDGKWHTTSGKTANRPFYRAFTSVQPKIESVAQKIFGGM